MSWGSLRVSENMTNLSHFMRKLCKNIVNIETQFINQKLILVQFKDLGIKECLVDFANGQEVVGYFTKILLQLPEER